MSRAAKGSGAIETYTYDSQNRLVGYAGASTATYAYDALDRRIAKTVDGAVAAFVYDSMDLGDSTASNTTLTFRAGQLIKRWLFGPQIDEPLAFEGYTATTSPGTGSVIELFANRLGSIITAISVSTGAVAAEYDYDSFGTRTQTGALEQPYGFTGREHDAESGLMHYRARVYDPAVGVFLQVDPIEMASGDSNLFAYAFDDPQNLLDPSGLTVSSAQFRNMVETGVEVAIGAARINPAVLQKVGQILDVFAELFELHNSYVDAVNASRNGGRYHGNDGRNSDPQVCYGGHDSGGSTHKVGVANAKKATQRWKVQQLELLYNLKRRELLSIPGQVAARALIYAVEAAIAHVMLELDDLPGIKNFQLPCHKWPLK